MPGEVAISRAGKCGRRDMSCLGAASPWHDLAHERTMEALCENMGAEMRFRGKLWTEYRAQ